MVFLDLMDGLGRWLLAAWISLVVQIEALEIGVGIADVTGPAAGIPFVRA